jgi:hypothetical protein
MCAEMEFFQAVVWLRLGAGASAWPTVRQIR